MVYLNENAKISRKMDEINPICDTLLVFVKNTPEGCELVKQMEYQPPTV